MEKNKRLSFIFFASLLAFLNISLISVLTKNYGTPVNGQYPLSLSFQLPVTLIVACVLFVMVYVKGDEQTKSIYFKPLIVLGIFVVFTILANLLPVLLLGSNLTDMVDEVVDALAAYSNMSYYGMSYSQCAEYVHEFCENFQAFSANYGSISGLVTIFAVVLVIAEAAGFLFTYYVCDSLKNETTEEIVIFQLNKSKRKVLIWGLIMTISMAILLIGGATVFKGINFFESEAEGIAAGYNVSPLLYVNDEYSDIIIYVGVKGLGSLSILVIIAALVIGIASFGYLIVSIRALKNIWLVSAINKKVVDVRPQNDNYDVRKNDYIVSSPDYEVYDDETEDEANEAPTEATNEENNETSDDSTKVDSSYHNYDPYGRYDDED